MVNDEMLKKLKDQYIGVEVPDDEKKKLNEVLEYAEGFSFIEESEISRCTNVRELSLDEIKKRNKELYIKWWADREERRLNGEDVSYLLIPPTIGTVQLD